MTGESFETRVSGKWVLTGEHAVLRGATAIALPHPEYALTLQVSPGPALELPEAVRAVITLAIESLKKGGYSGASGAGRVELQSTIPLGAGLGSSAALCVAVTRWLGGQVGLPESEHFEFARGLENHFHGRSSGMDVAVVTAGEPIAFRMGERPRPLGITRVPRFTFVDTGVRIPTRDCVAQVDKLRRNEPVRAQELDDRMARASHFSEAGLRAYSSASSAPARLQALESITQAIRLAQECFAAWSLVPAEGVELIKRLENEGALAVKMTGAGGGGMVVALWGAR